MLRAGLVQLDWSFVFQIINTIILYLLLRHFLFVPVTNFMEKRRKGIEDSINLAESKNSEADEYKKEYFAKLQTAEDEGNNIIKQATKNADAKADKIIEEAKEDVTQLKDKALQDIESERKKAVNEIKDEISSIAILAASKVLETEIDKSKNKQLVDKFIKEVGEVKWQN